jgi:4-hydroxybenzoate polyprenyltransferase
MRRPRSTECRAALLTELESRMTAAFHARASERVVEKKSRQTPPEERSFEPERVDLIKNSCGQDCVFGTLARMIAALKILADVAIFRLKKLEMANMFAAVAIMLSLRLPWDDVGVRFGFGLLLNLLAYLTNDYFDVDQDLASPNKDHAKARFLKDHLAAAMWAQIGLAIALCVFGFLWSKGLVIALLLGAGICWVYSFKLKRLPYIDVLMMIAWGMAMPLVGFPLDRTLGWILVFQLALFSACFESIQVIRDHDEDVRSGVRTTAVRLGIPATTFLLRFFMIATAAYAILFINRWFGLALLFALAIPFHKNRADVYWNRVRMVMGIVWLAMLAWIFWYGSTTGLLFSVGTTDTIKSFAFLR